MLLLMPPFITIPLRFMLANLAKDTSDYLTSLLVCPSFQKFECDANLKSVNSGQLRTRGPSCQLWKSGNFWSDPMWKSSSLDQMVRSSAFSHQDIQKYTKSCWKRETHNFCYFSILHTPCSLPLQQVSFVRMRQQRLIVLASARSLWSYFAHHNYSWNCLWSRNAKRKVTNVVNVSAHFTHLKEAWDHFQLWVDRRQKFMENRMAPSDWTLPNLTIWRQIFQVSFWICQTSIEARNEADFLRIFNPTMIKQIQDLLEYLRIFKISKNI